MKNRTKILLEEIPAWMLTIVTVCAILWLTLAQKPLGEHPLPLFPGADKVAHGLMFGFLTLVILLDSVRRREWVKADWWILLAAVSGSALAGIGIEYLQRAMNIGRSFDPMDMVADCVGSLIAGLGWLIWELKRHGHNGR